MFDYEKAYCVFAVPSFENLPLNVKRVHANLIPLVEDLVQDRKKDFLIPICRKIREQLHALTTEQICELSRASYFVGHWKPSVLPCVFNNEKGVSWKISSCCDQILRERLAPLPDNVEIHEGKFRVTLSKDHCWMFEEFGLATEKNLQIFKTYSESVSLNEHCYFIDRVTLLAKQINDLWGDPDDAPNNHLYECYLAANRVELAKKLQKRYDDTVKEVIDKVTDAKIERDFKLLCVNADIPIDNLIFHGDKGEFHFGWRYGTHISKGKIQEIKEKLSNIACQYCIKIKVPGEDTICLLPNVLK